MSSTTHAGTHRAFASPWAYLLAAPVVVLMTMALINDPGRVDDPSSTNNLSLREVAVIALIMTGLLGGLCALSRFRYRAVVAAAQVAVVWVGGLLYGLDVRTTVTYWDVAEDAFLLLTTLLQLVPGDRTTPSWRRPRASETAHGTEPRPPWGRLRRPVGLVCLVWIIVRNYDNLTSGEALPTAAALALIAFFAWITLRPIAVIDPREVTADQWRSRNRREMAWWTGWTLAAATIVGWASAQNGFTPRSIIVVVLPLLPLLASAFGYAKADVIVERAAQRS